MIANNLQKQKCPKCTKHESLEIIYGAPTPEAAERIKKGLQYRVACGLKVVLCLDGVAATVDLFGAEHKDEKGSKLKTAANQLGKRKADGLSALHPKFLSETGCILRTPMPSGRRSKAIFKSVCHTGSIQGRMPSAHKIRWVSVVPRTWSGNLNSCGERNAIRISGSILDITEPKYQ